MIPTLVNNPLFRGITPERLLADLEEISFHTRSYKKGEIWRDREMMCKPSCHPDQRKCAWGND